MEEMEVESLEQREVIEELVALDTWMPNPQDHPWGDDAKVLMKSQQQTPKRMCKNLNPPQQRKGSHLNNLL